MGWKRKKALVGLTCRWQCSKALGVLCVSWDQDRLYRMGEGGEFQRGDICTNTN